MDVRPVGLREYRGDTVSSDERLPRDAHVIPVSIVGKFNVVKFEIKYNISDCFRIQIFS